METSFEKQSFAKRLKSMLRVDFRRGFTMPLIYIMAGIGFVIPILILVMTSMTGGAADGEATAEGFTSVWQAIGSLGGSPMSMDITGMCNINLLYFLIVIFVCIFVAEDFRSGYAKILFTVRSPKAEYVISKSVVGFAGGTIMMVFYLIGAMIGGAIAGLSFDAGTTGAAIAACIFSKIFLTAIFVSISLLLSVAVKRKLWLSILGSFAASMLLITVLPMMSPLDASIVNVILCLSGGAAFGAGLGAFSVLILKKTDLV